MLNNLNIKASRTQTEAVLKSLGIHFKKIKKIPLTKEIHI